MTDHSDSASTVDREALRPCPFCGGEAQRFTITDANREPDNIGGDVITCTRCQASSHVEFGYKENLVSRWNARNPDPEVERLREALKPFLRVIDGAPADATDGDFAAVRFGDLRALRAALVDKS